MIDVIHQRPEPLFGIYLAYLVLIRLQFLYAFLRCEVRGRRRAFLCVAALIRFGRGITIGSSHLTGDLF
jgi:hypothetical protein